MAAGPSSASSAGRAGFHPRGGLAGFPPPPSVRFDTMWTDLSATCPWEEAWAEYIHRLEGDADRIKEEACYD